MNRLNKQRGDTIVEVLIAIALVSFVLVLAFGLSNRSTDTVRGSQEHSEALKLAESQLERLHATPAGLNTATNQCFDASGTAATGSACAFTGSGTHCTAASSGYCYQVKVTSVTGAPGSLTLYTTTVTWDRLGGGLNKVTLDYRT